MLQYPQTRAHSVWYFFCSLYITQYIGIGFISVALIAILRQQGYSLSQLAMVQLMALPAALKFLWAPVIDSWGHTSRAHYKNWLLLAQASMVLTLFGAGFLQPAVHLHALLLVLFCFAILTATQDLALDALSCKVFTVNQRASVSLLQVGCGLIGNMIGGGLVLILYPDWGWKMCLMVMAVLTSLAWLQLVFFPEPSAAKIQTNTLYHSAKQWFAVWKGNRGWLILLLLYPFGFMPIFSILTPNLVDHGWALPDIGFAIKVFGSLVGIGAVVLAKFWFQRHSRVRNVQNASLLQAVCLVALIPPALGFTGRLWVYVGVFGYFISLPLLYASITAVMMDKASQTDAPATAYTIQNALPMLVAFIAAALSMSLAQHFGYAFVAILAVTCSATAAVLSRFVLSSLSSKPHES
ncbi:MFS transporter [Vitreoscilla stercoraria]|uniref:MFS transporter n=1 Tax=Vitreoscilla stercoraria TaxID=61 RepID=A0ABY4E8Y6_VITST|nr:MFS transporter [Vitreoscilla stercoraria]UOO91380.1 MFS transporter [Vitreoscilla stercoraria]